MSITLHEDNLVKLLIFVHNYKRPRQARNPSMSQWNTELSSGDGSLTHPLLVDDSRFQNFLVSIWRKKSLRLVYPSGKIAANYRCVCVCIYIYLYVNHCMYIYILSYICHNICIDQFSATWPLWKNFLLPKTTFGCQASLHKPLTSRAIWIANSLHQPCAGWVSMVIQVRTIRGKGQFLVHGIPLWYMHTLQEINISHLGKRKIIFKMSFLGDMLVPWRVSFINPYWWIDDHGPLSVKVKSWTFSSLLMSQTMVISMLDCHVNKVASTKIHPTGVLQVMFRFA